MAKKEKEKNCRLGAVGGQAVMGGVMMRSKTTVATAVRRAEDGIIVVRTKPTKSIRDRVKIFRIPILRGIVNFIEMLILSFSTLTASAEMLGLEAEEGGEGEPSRLDKWAEKHGDGLMSAVSVISVVLGIALAMGLFIFLPVGITSLIQRFSGTDLGWYKNLIEGALKIIIFVAYIWLTSLIPEIRKVYGYHGAEHKSIFCYEAGEELTTANIRRMKRFHPRCGTSFMFVMVILSIVVSAIVLTDTWNIWLRSLYKLLLLPLIVGVGYEFIMYAGKHNNVVTKILSAPGLWMQRLTTKEPDDSMIECAIVSIKSALPEVFPEFEIPYEDMILEQIRQKKEEEAEDAKKHEHQDIQAAG